MNINQYNELINTHIQSSIKVCVEKCCGYKFIFLLNSESKLSDLYHYVIQFYSHVTEPILLYLDRQHEIMIPNNNILFTKYLEHNNIISATPLNIPVVYEFYLDLCSKHKNIYNQNY